MIEASQNSCPRCNDLFRERIVLLGRSVEFIAGIIHWIPSGVVEIIRISPATVLSLLKLDKLQGLRTELSLPDRVQVSLRHADFQTTMDRYVESAPESAKEAMGNLERLTCSEYAVNEDEKMTGLPKLFRIRTRACSSVG